MFGDALRAARLKSKMTQEELAYAAELDRTYISHLENNKKSPTLDVVFRLCDAMAIKASTLVEQTDQERKK